MAKPPIEAPAKNQAQAERLATLAKGQPAKETPSKDKGKPEPKPVAAVQPAKDSKDTSKDKPAQEQKSKAGTQQSADSKKPGGPVHYSVENGETVWSIARKFKVDPNALLAWNNLDKSVHLKPGDKLKINVQ
jgi:membrane-bound lytic murein transglycosylase D